MKRKKKKKKTQHKQCSFILFYFTHNLFYFKVYNNFILNVLLFICFIFLTAAKLTTYFIKYTKIIPLNALLFIYFTFLIAATLIIYFILSI